MKNISKQDYIDNIEKYREYQPFQKDIYIDIDYDDNIVDQLLYIYKMHRSYIDRVLLNERPELYNYVLNKTSCLDSYQSNFITRLKFVLEKRRHIPRCAECGRELNLMNVKPTRDWPICCCIQHSCSHELQQRRQENYFLKTGFRHQMQNPDVKKKQQETVFQRTGYKYSFQNPNTKIKLQQTIFEKYHCKNVMHHADIVSKVIYSTRKNKYMKMMMDDKIKPLFTLEQFIKFNREKDDRLWWQCLNPDCLHVFNASIAHGIDSISGTYARCPFCFPKAQTWTSHAEIELANWCRTVIPEDWHVYNNDDLNWNSFSVQFDILITDSHNQYKCAVEYNGNYYHSVDFQVTHGIDYDRIIKKTKLLENFGIPLIHIYEDEWKNLHKQIKIKKFLQFVFQSLQVCHMLDLKRSDQIIKLSRDKYSKALSIKNYHIIGEQPPIEIKRGIYNVLNCGFLIYERDK